MRTPDESAFRTDPPDNGSERELLQGFLEFHRGTLLWKCAGLTGEQLVKASTEPSTMTLLGLVRHLTEVERYWFDLDFTFRRPKRDGEWSLRWLYIHMVEEYARHNGHADLIRERVDGVTGE